MTYGTGESRDFTAVLLGSGGWMPTPTRATSCLLIRDQQNALVLDAGTGVVTLCRQRELLRGVDRIDIALSHFHLDHVAGLTYLPALADGMQLTVWAPGRLLRGIDSRDILSQLVGDPFLSVGLSEFATVEELEEGDNAIGSWPVTTRIQPHHPGRSVGFRIGDALAYCTDTAPDPDCAVFVRGVALLVHEAWTAHTPSHEHSSAESAAATAAAAGAGRLVLSHVNPLGDDPDALLKVARQAFTDTEVGYDGQPLG